jgi:SHS2 domain-containing protein
VLERRIEVSSPTAEDTVIDWLSEVITTAAARGEAYGDVRIERADENTAVGVLSGEPIDESRHELRFDVKAATYHGLEYARSSGGFRCRVIFDL